MGRGEMGMHACMCSREGDIGRGGVRKVVVFARYLRICLIFTHLLDIYVFACGIGWIFTYNVNVCVIFTYLRCLFDMFGICINNWRLV